MAKILGYYNDEINKLYIMSTTIVALGSFIIAIPVTNFIISKIWIIGHENSAKVPWIADSVEFEGVKFSRNALDSRFC